MAEWFTAADAAPGRQVLCPEEAGARGGRRGPGGQDAGQGDQVAGAPSSLLTLTRPAPDFDFLPTVEPFQRHELTLLRMEDILNTGSDSKPSGLESAGLESSGQGR